MTFNTIQNVIKATNTSCITAEVIKATNTSCITAEVIKATNTSCITAEVMQHKQLLELTNCQCVSSRRVGEVSEFGVRFTNCPRLWIATDVYQHTTRAVFTAAVKRGRFVVIELTNELEIVVILRCRRHKQTDNCYFLH